jgi:hypothetical protein
MLAAGVVHDAPDSELAMIHGAVDVDEQDTRENR